MSFDGLDFNADELMASLEASSSPQTKKLDIVHPNMAADNDLDLGLDALLAQAESPGGAKKATVVSPREKEDTGDKSLKPKKKLER